MKRRLEHILVIILLMTSLQAFGQFAQEFAMYEYDAAGLELIRSGKITDAVKLYAKAIETAKKNRTAGEGVPADLLGEYAYVLALSHDFDAALLNIERSRALNGKYANFYAAQILELMGLNDAAEVIGKGAI